MKRQIIKKKKNAHENLITNFRHYTDEFKKRDLLLSISSEDNNIKVWDIEKLDNYISNIKDVNECGLLSSACFLKEFNNIYIITSNNAWPEISEPIKIYNLKGEKFAEINESKERTFFIDNYYDENSFKIIL